jgi:hypothetical protein
MRAAILFLLAGTLACAQVPNKRYGVELDRENFPQETPKEALDSIIKAIQMKKVDYLVAQLADPAFVDQRIKEHHGGKFEEMVRETTTNLVDKPETIKILRRFLKEGKWEGEKGTEAAAKVPGVKDALFLRKIDDRWFLENRNSTKGGADKEKPKEKEKDDK